MLFKQRQKEGSWARFKLWLWPRVSWRRSSLYYLKRMLRLSGTPYAVATGVAAGAGVAFTPFIGFHFILAFALAWLVRGNLIAAAFGTCIGNPLTFPFIWAATYQLGRLLLGAPVGAAPGRIGEDIATKSFDQIWPLIKPMTVGSVPLGIIAGAVVYFVVYKAVSAYQESRRRRLAERRRPRIADEQLAVSGSKRT